jgi:hypothetical protein
LAATAWLLALHAAISWWPVHVRSQQRGALEAQYEPLRQMKMENKSLQREIDETLDNSQLELALSNQTPVVTLVGVVSRAAAETDGKVFLDNLAYSQRAETQAAEGGESIVTLEGMGADAVAVGQFADRLKSAVEFAEVRVESVETIEINQRPMQVFKIEFAF